MKKTLACLLVLASIFAVMSFSASIDAETPITVYLDNELVKFDVEPQIVNGRTMVPVRAIFEKLGAEVLWDDPTKTATATKGNTVVKITINASVMTVSGVEVALDTPAMIIDSRTLVPLRAVSSAFGCQVGWHNTERKVSLVSDTENFVMLYSDKGSMSVPVSKACAECDAGWFCNAEMTEKFAHSYLGGACTLCGRLGGDGMTEIQNGTLKKDSYYQNNLADSAADPFVLVHDGKYYLYATGGSRFTVRVSDDLVNWRSVDEPILALSETSWAKKSGWAPEVYEYEGKFYFIYSAQNEAGIHCIDIAVCDTPYGKFKSLGRKPFYAPGYSVIDASLFFDDDGRIYLYYSKDCSTNVVDGKKTSQTYGIEVKKDFSGTIGEPVLISTPTYEWELKSGNTLWNEGPVVFKENGVYYLLFSANFYKSQHYAVGYATSDSPLRFFDKSENSRILVGNGSTVTGPGHCNYFRLPESGQIYIAYHVHTVPPNTDNGRSLAIDRLIINEDGTLAIDGPSETARPFSGFNGYYIVDSDFTYTVDGLSSMLKRGSAVENIFDKMTSAGSTGILSLSEGATVSVKFDKPTKLQSIWVIPSSFENYYPGSADIVINGKYMIKDVKFGSSDCASAVFTLDNLPAGTLIEDIKIILHTAADKSFCALSEILFIGKE